MTRAKVGLLGSMGRQEAGVTDDQQEGHIPEGPDKPPSCFPGLANWTEWTKVVSSVVFSETFLCARHCVKRVI